MAGRWTKWLVLAVSAWATADLALAAGLIASGGPARREPPLAIHRPGTPNVGSGLLDAAERASDAGRYAEAEALALEALAVREKVYGPSHRALIRPLCDLSDSRADRDRFDEAEPPARRALSIAEGCPGPPRSKRIMLGRLAAIVVQQGRRAEADDLSGRASGSRKPSPASIPPNRSMPSKSGPSSCRGPGGTPRRPNS